MANPILTATNLATHPFKGWGEAVLPGPSAFYAEAFVGEPVGPRAHRVYTKLDLPPVNARAYPLTPAAAQLELPITTPILPDELPMVGLIGLGPVTFVQQRALVDGPCASYHGIGRVGPFVVHLHAWRFAAEPWVRFELAPVHSDPTNQDLLAWHQGITIAHKVAYPHVARPALEQVATLLQVGGWARNVIPPAQLANGQGHTAVRGMLLFYTLPGADLESMQALMEEEVWTVANTWPGAFGPHGNPPLLAPELGDGRAVAIARYQKWRRDSVSRAEWDQLMIGLVNDPGSTGDNEDFGTGKAAEVLSPAALFTPNLSELLHCAYAEWRRPIHYREANGVPIKAKDHPDWVSWSEETHWHPGRSPDRLGKPTWFPAVDKHGQAGRNNQHHSSMRLGSTTLLTGSRLMLEEIHDHVEHWLKHAEDTAGRAVGRMLQSACWYHLLTGREDLFAAIIANVEEVAKRWPGHGKGWAVNPSSWGPPDDRQVGGHWPYWNGWADALAYPGIWAAYELTKSPVARALCKEGSYSSVRYAWFKRPSSGSSLWLMAHGIRYLGIVAGPNDSWVPAPGQGDPLPAEAYLDPTQVDIATQGDFDLMAYGSVVIARTIALEDGDAPDVVAKADSIIAQIKADRPTSTTFARIDDWMAIG